MTILAVLFSEGGLGDVGRHVVQQALKIPGIQVRAIAPMPEMLTQPIESLTQLEGLENHERLQKLKWDSSMPHEALCEAIDGVDAVINCHGNREMGYKHTAGPTAQNVVACMKEKKVSRLVSISSVGMSEDWPPLRWSWFGTIFSCMFVTVPSMRGARRDLNKLESNIKSSGLDYLLVRPVGIPADAKPQGGHFLLPARFKGRVNGKQVNVGMAKEDVAAFMINEALEPTLHHTAITLCEKQEGAEPLVIP